MVYWSLSHRSLGEGRMAPWTSAACTLLPFFPPAFSNNDLSIFQDHSPLTPSLSLSNTHTHTKNHCNVKSPFFVKPLAWSLAALMQHWASPGPRNTFLSSIIVGLKNLDFRVCKWLAMHVFRLWEEPGGEPQADVENPGKTQGKHAY